MPSASPFPETRKKKAVASVSGNTCLPAIIKNVSQGQTVLFPCSPEEKIPRDSPRRLINQVVEEPDISCLLKACKDGGTSRYKIQEKETIPIFFRIFATDFFNFITTSLWIFRI
jgi:hypothetical protein